jgi:hypothetical protein
LLELATYTKLETNIFHKDVIDAMFRQPFSSEAKPYKTNLVSNGIVLNAVDYDLGRNGVAYFDNDTANYRTSGKPGMGNRGRVYRNDGVDIRKDSAGYESYYVSDIEDGEWLQYTVDIAKKGVYILRFNVASDNATGKISISSGKTSLATNVSVPNTGSLKDWQTFEIKNIVLTAGKQALRIYADSGGFNLKSIRFITKNN